VVARERSVGRERRVCEKRGEAKPNSRSEARGDESSAQHRERIVLVPTSTCVLYLPFPSVRSLQAFLRLFSFLRSFTFALSLPTTTCDSRFPRGVESILSMFHNAKSISNCRVRIR